MVNSTSDLATFKRDFIKFLVDFIDSDLTEKDWLLIRGHKSSVQKVNYRMDRQGKLLKGLFRSKGPNGGSFHKSKPTLAQVEIECGSCVTVEKLKEALYASMIPEEKYIRLGYLHHVVVRKEQVPSNPVNLASC